MRGGGLRQAGIETRVFRRDADVRIQKDACPRTLRWASEYRKNSPKPWDPKVAFPHMTFDHHARPGLLNGDQSTVTKFKGREWAEAVDVLLYLVIPRS